MSDLRRRWRWLPVLAIAGIVLHVWVLPTRLPSPDVGIDVLFEVPDHLSRYIFTENAEADGNPHGLAKIGTPGAYVELPNSDILDVRTGEPMAEHLDRTSFNLAILPLPRGSKWDYVGVARGPLRRRDFMQLNGHPSIEHVMLA